MRKERLKTCNEIPGSYPDRGTRRIIKKAFFIKVET